MPFWYFPTYSTHTKTLERMSAYVRQFYVNCQTLNAMTSLTKTTAVKHTFCGKIIETSALARKSIRDEKQELAKQLN